MKNKVIWMAVIAVIALVIAVVCLVNLGVELPSLGNSIAAYSRAATNHGLSGSYLSKNEVLLVDSVDKQAGKTVVTYKIFSLAEGQKAEDFWNRRASDAHGLTEVGTASCEFIGDDVKNIRNFKVMHNI